MDSTKFIEYRNKIETEYAKACTKHPKFCDDFSGAPDDTIKTSLKHWRDMNSRAPYHADAILMEEIMESIEAYRQGDKAHCMEELAQCGAVILRMMDFIETEAK